MPSREKRASKAARARPPKAPKRRSTAATAKRTALARVTRERDEALEQQAATAEILKVISQSAFDLSAVLQALVSSAVRLCEADTGIVRRREGDTYPVAATFGFSENERDHFARYSVKPDRGSVFGRAILESRSIHVPDLLADRDLNRDRLKDYSKVVTIRTGLGVPLLREGKIIGVFTLQRRKRRPFTKKQIALAETFANQAVIAIENTRLFDEVQARTRDLSEALEQQTATSEVLEAISSSPGELTPVFSKMLENATRVCEATFGILNLWDGIHFRTAAGHNVPPAFAAVRRDKPIEPHPQSLLFKVLETHRLVHVHDAKTASGYLAGAPNAVEMVEVAGARTVLIVPMLKEDELIGTFTIFRQEVRPFTDKQIALLENFTKQAVIAIENTRLINETKEALERQTAMADILKVIASSPDDVQPVFEAIVQTGLSLFPSSAVMLVLADDGIVRPAAIAENDPKLAEMLKRAFPVPLTRDFMHTVAILDGRLIDIPDAESGPAEFPAGRSAFLSTGHRAITIMPMMRGDQSIGALSVVRRMPGSLSDRQLELLKTFADQAVIAIENTRLLKELRERTDDLSESLQQQTATADVLKAISRSTFYLQSVLDTLISSAVTLCGAVNGTMCLREGDGYRFRASFGIEGDWAKFIDELRPTPGRSSLTGRVLLSGRVESIPDVLEDPDYIMPLAAMNKTRSVLGVPLLRHEKVEGVLLLARAEPGLFTQRQIELVQTFADQAVIAIENVRLFDEVQAKTRDLSEALTYQTGSGNILSVIASSPTDVGPVLQAIVESACKLCEAFDAVVALKDGDVLRFGAHHGPIPLTGQEWAINRKWTAGRAFLDRTPVHVLDLLSAEGSDFPDGQELARRMGHRTVLSVPLLREGESIGTISLRRIEVQSFSDKQIALLQTFANQAVIAIGNVHMFEQVQAKTRDLTESLQQQTATVDVLKVISSSPGKLEPVFQVLLENAVRLCDAQFGVLCTYDVSGFQYVSARDASAEYTKYMQQRGPFRPASGVLDRIMRTKQPSHTADEAAEVVPGPAGTFGGARSLVGVPMLKNGELRGAIIIYRTEVRPFADQQIDLLTNFAAQAVIAIDNTRLLNELRHRTDDLTRSLQDLHSAQERLVQTEKLASLGQLTAGIAHEIKNPLNFVNNFSALSAELTDELKDLLKSAALSEKMREEVSELTGLLKDNLEKVVQHGKRADAIVKNMLLHSREGSREYRPADINSLLDESLNLAYHGARAEKGEFNITLQRDFDADAGTIELFPQEITRAFLNLISNGVYAATRRRNEDKEPGFEPTLRATTKNLGSTVEIRIRDNGTGIPADVQEKIFNPFFTTKPAGEGTGLGLSMTHDIIVKQHGGRIDVETEPGVFTEFIITLPRTTAPQKTAGGTN